MKFSNLKVYIFISILVILILNIVSTIFINQFYSKWTNIVASEGIVSRSFIDWKYYFRFESIGIIIHALTWVPLTIAGIIMLYKKIRIEYKKYWILLLFSIIPFVVPILLVIFLFSDYKKIKTN